MSPRVAGTFRLAEFVAAAVVGDAADAPVLDCEQLHRVGEDEAAMERLDDEAAVLAGPDLHRRQRLDGDVPLVGQVREHVGRSLAGAA